MGNLVLCQFTITMAIMTQIIKEKEDKEEEQEERRGGGRERERWRGKGKCKYVLTFDLCHIHGIRVWFCNHFSCLG